MRGRFVSPSLFSRCGGRGREKRAGVMRVFGSVINLAAQIHARSKYRARSQHVTTSSNFRCSVRKKWR